MKLTVTVTMGNDAMQTRRDAAEAICRALHRNNTRLDAPFSDGDDGVVVDANGNTVGTWEADDEDDIPEGDEFDRLADEELARDKP